MKIGQEGIDLIKKFEGCKLHAYQDSVGVWTIGYGHTTDVKRGDVITEGTATDYLRQDLEEAESGVRELIHVPLGQSEFDALVSFTFNLGSGNLARSTLRSKLNGHDRKGAADEFPKWVNAGGKKLKGLVRRRNAERAMFLGEDWKGF